MIQNDGQLSFGSREWGGRVLLTTWRLLNLITALCNLHDNINDDNMQLIQLNTRRLVPECLTWNIWRKFANYQTVNDLDYLRWSL